MKKINVGLIGLGTVGSQVYKILSSRRRRSKLRKELNLDIDIRTVCDKYPHRVSVDIKKDSNFTKNFRDLISDSEIDIVIELIGGIEPAKTIIEESLENGKHVVTANKALLAEHFELFELGIKNKRLIKFEASVGGGIPIIQTIQSSLISDNIKNIDGIVNGTSNYILTRMEEDKCSFKQALRMAQNNGYAEKDPSLDVKGIDSVHKLVVLANLCFNLRLKPKNIYCEGITHIEYNDILYAQESGYKIKLLTVAKRKNNELELRVHPTLLSEDRLLASVKGIFNAIYVESELAGRTLLYGRGAGGRPTGNAVVSNVIDISKKIQHGGMDIVEKFNIADDKIILKNIKDVITRYYIRLMVIDKPGVLAKISDVLGKCSISIASVKQKERRKSETVPLVMMTHEAKESNVQKAITRLNRLKVVRNKPVIIRIEEEERG